MKTDRSYGGMWVGWRARPPPKAMIIDGGYPDKEATRPNCIWQNGSRALWRWGQASCSSPLWNTEILGARERIGS